MGPVAPIILCALLGIVLSFVCAEHYRLRKKYRELDGMNDDLQALVRKLEIRYLYESGRADDLLCEVQALRRERGAPIRDNLYAGAIATEKYLRGLDSRASARSNHKPDGE